MKSRLFVIVLGVVTIVSTVNAQYYRMTNQLTQMLSPALSGSFNYKGYVDMSYLAGVGNDGKRADFFEITTTQGFQYASWFYMGVGAGVDLMFTPDYDMPGYYHSEETTKTAVMIPLYSDFRFNIGSREKTSMFIDLRLGASFLVSDDYVQMGEGYITGEESFYLRPSIGLRLPVNYKNPKQAINVSFSYQLITPEWMHSDALTLHSVGATIGFEW